MATDTQTLGFKEDEVRQNVEYSVEFVLMLGYIEHMVNSIYYTDR